MSAHKLTPKQKRFVDEYLSNGMNGTKAALTVFEAKNENVAGAIASEYLRKPKIQDEIRLFQEKRSKEAENTFDEWVKDINADIQYYDQPNPCRTRALELKGKALGWFNDKGELVNAGRSGFSKERREAMYRDILEITSGKKWASWVDHVKEWLKTLPESYRIEAEEIFKSNMLTELMFARIDLAGRLHALGEEYARKTKAGGLLDGT